MPQKTVIYEPQTDVPFKYNTRYKEFPDFVKATCFNRPVFNPAGVEKHQGKNQEKAAYENYLRKLENMQKVKALQDVGILDTEKRYYVLIDEDGLTKFIERETSDISRSDSVKRAKDKAYEIAYANEFHYFITLTLDAKRINRYDTAEVCRRLKIWLNNKVKRNGMSYLIFPERHKDGAIHFHGLMSGDMKMKESGHITSRGQKILNCEDWTLGFSTAVQLDADKAQVCGYIMKYITKEQKRVFAKHYFAGGGLIRELPTTYENQDFESFDADQEYSIPQAKTLVKYKTIQKVEDLGV